MWSEHPRGRTMGLTQFGGDCGAARPSLLCVHGSGGRGLEFAPLLEALGGGAANAAALDLPGHGGTPGPGRKRVLWGDYYSCGHFDVMDSLSAHRPAHPGGLRRAGPPHPAQVQPVPRSLSE